MVEPQRQDRSAKERGSPAVETEKPAEREQPAPPLPAHLLTKKPPATSWPGAYRFHFRELHNGHYDTRSS